MNPTDPNVWHIRFVCKNCSYNERAPFTSIFFAPDSCPDCGERKKNTYFESDDIWKVLTMKWGKKNWIVKGYSDNGFIE